MSLNQRELPVTGELTRRIRPTLKIFWKVDSHLLDLVKYYKYYNTSDYYLNSQLTFYRRIAKIKSVYLENLLALGQLHQIEQRKDFQTRRFPVY
jgi:hypothetical protein